MLVFKNIIVLFLIFIINISLFAQKKEKNFFINGVVGIKDITNVRTAPTFGIELGLRSLPFSLGLRESITTAALYPQYGYPTFQIYYNKKIIELDYRFQNKHDIPMRWGLGHYWQTEKTYIWLHTVYRRGVTAHYNIGFDNFEVEARAEIGYQRLFNPFEDDNFSLSFIRRFGTQQKEAKNISKNINLYKKVDTKFLFTGRVFPTPYKLVFPDTSNNEKYSYTEQYGMSLGIGMEFYFPKRNFSASIEKDWWLSFSPRSNFSSLINEYVSNTVLGVRYYKHLKKQTDRAMKIGTGLYLGIEGSVYPYEVNFTNKVIFTEHNRVGIPLSFAYPILDNIDLESRYIFMLKGEKPFNKARLSLGMVCRFE